MAKKPTFRHDLTPAEERHVTAFFEANDVMRRSDYEVYVNAKGNIVIRSDPTDMVGGSEQHVVIKGSTGRVFDVQGISRLSPRTNASAQLLNRLELREQRRLEEERRRREAEEQARRYREEARKRFLASYLGQHQGPKFPDEVIDLLRQDMARKAFLKTWQRPLVSAMHLSVSPDMDRIDVSYDMAGKSRATVRFLPVALERDYPAETKPKINSFEDEEKVLAKGIIEAGYEVTESGRKKILTACKKEIRAFVRRQGLPRAEHEFDNSGYDAYGHDLYDDITDTALVPVIEDGTIIRQHYGPVSKSRWSDFRQPFLVLCRFGRFRAYYDLRDGSVLLNEHDEQRVREYAQSKRHARKRRQALDLFEGMLGKEHVTSSMPDPDILSISVSRVVRRTVTIDLPKDTMRDIRRKCEIVKSDDADLSKGFEQRCIDSGLVGQLLPLAVIEFLVANHGTDSAEYITPNTIGKEIKGNPITIWSGVRHTELSRGKLSEFTHGDISDAWHELKRHGFVSVTLKTWDEGTYENVKAMMPQAQVLIDLAYRPAPPDTPVDKMTEMQLLSLFEGDVASRPSERLAEELPVLLEHPACYYAKPDEFMAYVTALPDYLRDYVRLTYKMSTDRVQRKMFRAVIAGMDGK